MKKDIPRMWTLEASWCSILIFDKIDFKPKVIRKYGEEHVIFIKEKSSRKISQLLTSMYQIKDSKVHKRNTTTA